MQARELKRLDKSLEDFLSKLTAGLGRSERRRWAGVYVRGLLLDGERKSIEPMAIHHGQLDLALGLLDQVSGWQSPVGVVLADEAYGGSFEWRLALRERGLFYGVRGPWTTTGWQEENRASGRQNQCAGAFGPSADRCSVPSLKHLLSIARACPPRRGRR